MFGSLGVPELLLIFVVILIVFGPRRIPEIGKTLGKALGEFRKATDDLKNTIEREVRLEELKSIAPDIRSSVGSISRSEPAPYLQTTEASVGDSPADVAEKPAALTDTTTEIAEASTAVAEASPAITDAPGAALRPEPDYLADPDTKRTE